MPRYPPKHFFSELDNNVRPIAIAITFSPCFMCPFLPPEEYSHLPRRITPSRRGCKTYQAHSRSSFQSLAPGSDAAHKQCDRSPFTERHCGTLRGLTLVPLLCL